MPAKFSRCTVYSWRWLLGRNALLYVGRLAMFMLHGSRSSITAYIYTPLPPSQWDEFFDEIQPIAAQVAYMVCIGNHERDFPNSGSYYQGTDSGGECGVPYERRFPMPRPSLDEPWWAHKHPPVKAASVNQMSHSQNLTSFVMPGSNEYESFSYGIGKLPAIYG